MELYRLNNADLFREFFFLYTSFHMAMALDIIFPFISDFQLKSSSILTPKDVFHF